VQVKQTVQDLKSRIDKLRAEQNAELQARYAVATAVGGY
jgi:hypothetical protein